MVMRVHPTNKDFFIVVGATVSRGVGLLVKRKDLDSTALRRKNLFSGKYFKKIFTIRNLLNKAQKKISF